MQGPRKGRRATQLVALIATGLMLAPGSGPDAPQLVTHLDAAPGGAAVDVSPTTRRLQAIVAADEFAATVASAVPAGEPGVDSLARHVAPSCSGTGKDGNRVQVVYAVENGRTDRYSKLKTQLRSWVADVDDTFAASAAKTGGGRLVRWVHHPVDGGCAPTIAHEVLPAGSLSNGFQATVKALRGRGYTKTSRKYLVFADTAKLCGVAGMFEDDDKHDNANDGAHAMYARVDSPCWAMSSGGHSVAAHEVMHMLGGVQNNAPHTTKAGHCRDETDAMCYDDGGALSKILQSCAGSEELFDCRNDDYFHTHPAAGSYLAKHWNTADSSFLDVTAGVGGAIEVVLKGATSVRPGLSKTYRAVTSAAGATFRWTADPAECVPGKRSKSSVVLACPSWYTGKVKLAVAVNGAGGSKAKASRSVTLVRSPKATVSSALTVSRPGDGEPAKVTAKLTYGTAAVRGTVFLYALDDGAWHRVSGGRDTGVDGRYTWKVSPRSDTRYAVRVGYVDDGGWLIPRQVVALVRAIL